MSTLPPDPDQMNDNRSWLASKALRRFQKLSRADDEDALGDLLCNLRHWCDRTGRNFDGVNERSRQMYLAEIGDPSSPYSFPPCHD
jgi:hypothetical protein